MKSNITIPIKTTPEDYYVKILEVIKVIPPFSNLRRRERQVYAELLYYYNLYKQPEKKLTEDEINRLVFGYDIKEKISDKYNISKDVVYNIMKELKKKGFVTGRSFNETYTLRKIDNINFIFQ